MDKIWNEGNEAGKRRETHKTSSGEIMRTQQRSGPGLICLVILIAIAIIAIAGCVDSTHNQQSLVSPTGTQQSETPVVTTTVTIRTTPAPTPQKTLARPTTGSSDGVIQLDPIGVIYAGEDYVITGTTSLPVGTDLILQLRPDDGTTPTGYDKEAGGSDEGTAQIRAGNGTVNRIVFEGSITPGGQNGVYQGKWVAVVGNGIGNGYDFEMGTHVGYAYFTME